MNDLSSRVVAIVPVFNGASLLTPCVDALLEDEAVDVLVVDDGSRDDSVGFAMRLAHDSGGRVRVLALARNHGFAGAVGRGVEDCLSRGVASTLLVFVNQDCVVRPGWLAPLREALLDPCVAVAGARLYEADGVTLQHTGARVHANGLTSHFGRGIRDEAFAREVIDCDYVCGALLALRAETWRRLGGFDQGYRPAYFEEVDFCSKARGQGMRVVYVPGSEAVHAGATCSSPSEFLGRYHQSRIRFVVRRLWSEAGFFRWARAEAAWLIRLRSSAQLRPVLAAYLHLPSLMAEAFLDRARSARSLAAMRTAGAPR